MHSSRRDARFTWLGGSGEEDNEFGAAAESAFNGDGAPHLFHHLLHDGQAQAGAAGGARARFIYAVEAFEDAFQIFAGNALPCIGNREADAAVGCGAAFDANFAAGFVELHGVIEKVDHDLFQAEAVAGDPAGMRAFEVDADVFSGGVAFHAVEGACDDFVQTNALGWNGERRIVIEFGNDEQIGRNVIETNGVIENDFDEAAVVGFVLKTAIEKSFGVTADSCERRAEFVRDVGHKLLAGFFLAFDIGDIV